MLSGPPIPPMQFSNRIIGLVAILGAFGIVLGTLGFREIPGQQFGSAFFPRITAGALALTGLLLVLSGKGQALASVPDWMRRPSALRAAAMPLAGIVWVLAVPALGFLLTTFLLIAALSLIAGGRTLTSLCVAAGLTAALHVVFGLLLRIPLPFGVIEGWL